MCVQAACGSPSAPLDGEEAAAAARCEWTARMRASEIPAAALMLGVNVPDHDATFRSLAELLGASVTPHVALVRAEECGSLGQLTKRVLERVMAVGLGDMTIKTES